MVSRLTGPVRVMGADATVPNSAAAKPRIEPFTSPKHAKLTTVRRSALTVADFLVASQVNPGGVLITTTQSPAGTLPHSQVPLGMVVPKALQPAPCVSTHAIGRSSPLIVTVPAIAPLGPGEGPGGTGDVSRGAVGAVGGPDSHPIATIDNATSVKATAARQEPPPNMTVLPVTHSKTPTP